MQDTVTRYLATVGSERDRANLRAILNPIADRYSSQATSTATLAIKAGGGVLAKNTAVYQGVASGVPVTIAVNTDMPALTGIDITAAYFRIVCFFIDSASVVTVAAGTEGSTLALAKFPPFPAGKALVGFLIITYASAFTGGSTALDTATTVYVSPVGPFDPSVLV